MHDPPLDPEVLAQPLDVGDQLSRCVSGQISCGINPRCTSPTTTLVEEDDSIGIWIEEAPSAGRTTRSMTAVEHDGGTASGVAACLPVELPAIANIQHAVVIGFNPWEEGRGSWHRRNDAFQDNPLRMWWADRSFSSSSPAVDPSVTKAESSVLNQVAADLQGQSALRLGRCARRKVTRLCPNLLADVGHV